MRWPEAIELRRRARRPAMGTTEAREKEKASPQPKEPEALRIPVSLFGSGRLRARLRRDGVLARPRTGRSRHVDERCVPAMDRVACVLILRRVERHPTHAHRPRRNRLLGRAQHHPARRVRLPGMARPRPHRQDRPPEATSPEHSSLTRSFIERGHARSIRHGLLMRVTLLSRHARGRP